MSRMLAIILALLLTPLGSTQAAIPGLRSTYKGADGGYLLLSASIAPGKYWFMFKYRALDGTIKSEVFAQPWNGFVRDERIVEPAPRTPPPPELQAAGLDYASNELLGYTLTARLPPGKYEIYRISGTLDARQYNASADVSIPFEIRPGRITYLGAFAAYPLTQIEKPLLRGPQRVLAGFRVVVTDAHERDVRLAKAQVSNLSGDVDVELADWSALLSFFPLRIEGSEATPSR